MAHLESPKILLVDDEKDFTSILSKVLRHRHFDVRTASDGLSALKALAVESFDVILLDVKMPGMDGLQVLKEVRKIAPFISIILMTGHLALSNEEKVFEQGAFAFVLKPHPIPDLVALVEKAVASARSAHETDQRGERGESSKT